MVFPSIVVLILWGCARGSAQVTERNASFSCCDGLYTFKFDPHCELIWIVNDRTIAHYATKPECEAPCQKMESGQMFLAECLTVCAVSTCTNEETGMIREETVNYAALACSRAYTKVFDGVTLLAVVVGGLLVRVMTC